MRRLTKEQKKALLPYLKTLRQRFAELAETGETGRPCTLCEKALKTRGQQSGNFCNYCPIFNDDCGMYMPVLPDEVSIGIHDACAPTKKARAWAARVVAILDEVERTATT